MKTCTEERCNSSVHARGLCNLHYRRLMKQSPPPWTKQRNVCSVESCDKQVSGRGLCSRHYALLRRNGTPSRQPKPSAEERLLRHVKKSSHCWNWQGPVFHETGYGVFWYKTDDAFEVSTHRTAYRIFVGPIPPDLSVLHSCDNRRCVNPKHLRVGTARDNAADRVVRNRSNIKYGEEHHHTKLSDADILTICESSAAGTSRAELAAHFGVHPKYVGALINGTTRRSPMYNGVVYKSRERRRLTA